MMPSGPGKPDAKGDDRKGEADADESAYPDDDLWTGRHVDPESVSDVDEPAGGFNFEDPDKRRDKPDDEEE